ncbi:hypothetical protein MTO96_020011 [Rhipicephalus appendiculatus]
MFDDIAVVLNRNFPGRAVTGSQVENKWRTLKRSYLVVVLALAGSCDGNMAAINGTDDICQASDDAITTTKRAKRTLISCSLVVVRPAYLPLADGQQKVQNKRIAACTSTR